MNESPAGLLGAGQDLAPDASAQTARPTDAPGDLMAVMPPRATRAFRTRRRLLALLALGALAAIAVAGYRYTRYLGSRPTFQTAPVVRGPLVAAISATGTLNAVTTVQVGSQVSGQIREIYADFNAQVTKGQIIARIDPEIFQAQVNQARAQLGAAQAAVLNQQAMVAKTHADRGNARAALAAAHAQSAKAQVAVLDSERTLTRQQELRRRDLIAQADLDSAQAAHDSAIAQHEASLAQESAQAAAVDSAEAQLEVAEAQLATARAQVTQSEAALRQAEINLEHTIIRAPVNGVVVSRNVDVGQTVAASLQAPTLFLIAQDLTKMQVDTNVDEADVGRVRVGQPVTFTVDSFPGHTFTGTVIQIRKAPQVIQNVVTYDVVVSAPNPDLALLPGMTANVRIVTDAKPDVLKIPNAALRFRPPGATTEPAPRAGAADLRTGQVWALGAHDVPEPVPVRPGMSDGTSTEVLGGALGEHQRVIIGPVSPTPTPAAPSGGFRLRF